MSALPDKVSSLIQTQFPAFYREDGDKFVAFVKAYYEWLEQSDNVNYISRKLLDYRDIDKTIDSFLVHFKNKYLANIPLTSFADTRSIVKKSLDIYRSKGSEASVELLFRLLFGEEASVYYPGQDIIKPSDGIFNIPRYVELTPNEVTKDMEGKEIVGVTSGAKAFVDFIARRQYKGYPIDQVFLSNIRGNFLPGETVTANGTIEGNPKVLGSLTSLEIVTESSGFIVGEDVDVISDLRGRNGRARIIDIGFATGQLAFLLQDGGFGYVRRVRDDEGDILEGSNIYIASHMFAVSNTFNRATKTFNANTDVGVPSSNFIRLADSVTFNALNDVDGSADTIAVTNNPFEYGDILLYSVSGGNTVISGLANNGLYHVVFANTTKIALSDVPAGANLNLTTGSNESGHRLSKQTNPFLVGDTVQYFTIRSNTALTNLANNDTYYVVAANNLGIKLSNTEGGTEATLTPKSGSETHFIYGPLNRQLGNFKLAEKITQHKFRFYHSTSGSLWNNGFPPVETLVVAGNATHDIANGYVVAANTESVIVVSDTREFYSNTDVVTLRSSNSSGSNTEASSAVWAKQDFTTNGYLTGVNSQYIGMHLVTGNGSFVNASADETVNIPSLVVGVSSNTATYLGRKFSGSGGNVAIGQVSPVDRIFIRTDFIGGNNDIDVPYLSLNINEAQYDFPKFPAGDLNTIIDKCLASNTINVGSIAVFSEVNPGEEYNVDPFVLAYEPRVAGYGKKDLRLSLANLTKPFSVGERLTISSGSITSVTITSGGTGYSIGDPITFGNNTVSGVGAYAIVNTVSAGAITSINVISGGAGYNADMEVSACTAGTPAVLDLTTSNITTNTSIIGQVITFSQNTTTNTAIVDMKRLKFFMPLSGGIAISGVTSLATANLVSFVDIPNTYQIGLNAVILANTNAANGTIVNADVIDSGIGYQQDEIVILQPQGTGRNVASARVNAERQGVSQGSFKNTQGFLNSDKYIHDNDYYQEFSYEIRTGVSLDKYASILKQVLHVAGTKYFGNVLKVIADIKEQANVSDTEVAITRYFAPSNVSGTLDFISGNNQYSNGSLIFSNNNFCLYTRDAGNSTNFGLVNNEVYVVTEANTSGVKLAYIDGLVYEINIEDGGTGYSNTTSGITITSSTGTGATANLTTDGAGVITTVTMITRGRGYSNDIIVSANVGTSAEFSVTLKYSNNVVDLTDQANNELGHSLTRLM